MEARSQLGLEWRSDDPLTWLQQQGQVRRTRRGRTECQTHWLPSAERAGGSSPGGGGMDEGIVQSGGVGRKRAVLDEEDTTVRWRVRGG